MVCFADLVAERPVFEIPESGVSLHFLSPYVSLREIAERFIFATESYGARFAPIFINYFNAQNALVDSGNLQGVKIVVSALMINELVPRLLLRPKLTNLPSTAVNMVRRLIMQPEGN